MSQGGCGNFPQMLERVFSPVGLDFAVDLSPGDPAFAVLAGCGADCSKGLVFRRKGVEKFLEILGSELRRLRAKGLRGYFHVSRSGTSTHGSVGTILPGAGFLI